jgi:non-canonical purine NTP pyrophosphatase (RdgB/HAM1 family)
MVLYFISGNKNKFEQVKQILFPEIKIEQLDIDLIEIQEVDSHKVLQHKLLEAQKHHKGEFLVEDTSLYIDAMGGLPGPLIKWFLKMVGAEGLYKMTQKLGHTNAKAKAIFGYSSGEEVKFFEGEILGDISPPGKDDGFGWNRIFIPNGQNKVLSEMTQEEKIKVGMRKIALEKFKEYYLKK